MPDGIWSVFAPYQPEPLVTPPETEVPETPLPPAHPLLMFTSLLSPPSPIFSSSPSQPLSSPPPPSPPGREGGGGEVSIETQVFRHLDPSSTYLLQTSTRWGSPKNSIYRPEPLSSAQPGSDPPSVRTSPVRLEQRRPRNIQDILVRVNEKN
ncbi:unnamed protein product [Boreogadus saida]